MGSCVNRSPFLLALAAAIVVYVTTFFRITMEQRFAWFEVLHVGVLALIGPMFFVESSALRARTFFWRDFGKTMPRWAVPGIKLLGALAIAHFVLFLVLTRATSPQLKNGNYVLDSHGKTVRIISEPEYYRLKGWELRMFAAYWIFFYSVPALYWWFPRRSTTERTN